MTNDQPYKNIINDTKKIIANLLHSYDSTHFKVLAAYRIALDLMDYDLKKNTKVVVEFYDNPKNQEKGFDGPKTWRNKFTHYGLGVVDPGHLEEPQKKIYDKRMKEYEEIKSIIRGRINQPFRGIDNVSDVLYTISDHPLKAHLINLIIESLDEWINLQPLYPAFLNISAYEGWEKFLEERPEVTVMSRIAGQLPQDVRKQQLLKSVVERPLIVQVAEFIIGMTPVVGNIVGMYEAVRGKDLFGYELTDDERVIIGMMSLIPSGRLTSRGSIVPRYRPKRLVHLYGKAESSWFRAIEADGRGLVHPNELRVIEEAGELVVTKQKLPLTLKKSSIDAVRTLINEKAVISYTVDNTIKSLHGKLSPLYPSISFLDDLALERVITMGPYKYRKSARLDVLLKRKVFHSRIKGQLLEEIVESQVVPWLHTRAGSFGLGIKPDGRKLHFIPGGVIKDEYGKKVLDGILGSYDKKIFDMHANFEVKSGPQVVGEATGGFEKNTPRDLKEKRKFAEDVYEEELERAIRARKPYKKTMADIHRELNIPTEGGQIRRDIERLYPNADKPLQLLWLGEKLYQVRFSPANTKTFIVTPKDIDAKAVATIHAEAKRSHLNIELITPNILYKDLDDIAEQVVTVSLENLIK